MDQKETQDHVRLDTWLWAARFFRTRALARAAISAGKVRIDGQASKPGQRLRIGTCLTIQAGPASWTIEVVNLSQKRGPAALARTLYSETEENRGRREAQLANYRLIRQLSPAPDTKPNKHIRRQLRGIKRNEN